MVDRSSSRLCKPLALLIAALPLWGAAPAHAQDVENVAGCLKAWGKHPFGAKPDYKTLATAVKVFGIGQNTADTQPTAAPALVLVNPGVNVMGGSTIELMNPNGWYCLRSNVNVMGGVTIKLHCKAKIAMTTDGATVLGTNTEDKGVTVMGSTRVEREGC